MQEKEQACDMTLAKISELVHELADRGQALWPMSTAVNSLRQRYKALDKDLSRTMTTGVRLILAFANHALPIPIHQP